MSYSKDEINLYSKFDFTLLLRTEWLHRHVESWEYVGDAQWHVKLSLDINSDKIRKYHQETVPSKGKVDEHCQESILNRALDEEEEKEEATAHRIINIPVLNVRKSAQFTDFSVSDKNGRPINLLLREMGCHVALNQLEGAILTLHGDQAKKFGERELPPLSQKRELSKFLVSLFKETLPPTGEDDKAIEFGEPGTYKQVKDHIEKSIKALPKDPEWRELSIDSLREDFDEYWEHSRVFKYLVSLNVLRWLACVKVNLDEDDFSMVKMSFLTSRNIVGEARKKSPFKRSRGSGKVSLDIDLDGVGASEVCHVLVHAPSGTQFAPCKPKKSQEQGNVGIKARMLQSKPLSKIRIFFADLLKRKTPEHRFFIVKSLLERKQDESEFPPEAIAFGSLTPACATVKVQMGWSSSPIGDDGESKGDHLYRKIPVHDSHAGVYKMCLNLMPKLGARSWGYLAYFGFSALFAIAICLEYASTASTADIIGFSSTFLLTLATIVAMVLIASKEVPFVSRRVFKFPFWLSRACTFFNVLVLFIIMIQGTGVLGLNVPCVVLFLAALANSLMSIIYGFWCLLHRHRSSWTSAPDSFNVTKIPIYIDLKDQQINEQ